MRKSLTSKNEFESCNEQSYVRTLRNATLPNFKRFARIQQQISRYIKIKVAYIGVASYQWTANNICKVLQITDVRQAKSIREKQERNKLINIIKIVFAKNHAYLMLTNFVDPS